MTLQVNRTFLSPNRSSGWLYGPPNKVVIHSTRSGQAQNWNHVKEMSATINWFMGTNSSASSNLVISPTEIVRMVPDEFPSWHAKEHSWQAYGIEVTQPLRDSPIEDGHYELLAQALRHYQSLGVEPVWLPSLTWGDTASGWIQHLETDQGLRDGKSDIGPQLHKARLRGMVITPSVEEDDMDEATLRRILQEEVTSGPTANQIRQLCAEAVDSFVRPNPDWIVKVKPEHAIALRSHVEALAAKVEGLTVGGVDYAKLAKAVNDDAAARLKE